MSEDKSIMQWGGVAGIMAGILFVLTLVILLAFVPAAPADNEELVARFPDVRTATIFGEVVYAAAIILWVMLVLALYRALRSGSTAPALFGTGVGLLGLVFLGTGAVPGVAFSHISGLYHAPGATPEDRATLTAVWQGAQGMFNETDTMGFIFLTVGMILLGVAMVRSFAFGRRFGGAGILIGVVGLAGTSMFSPDSVMFAPFAAIVVIVYPLLMGWKVYRVSRMA